MRVACLSFCVLFLAAAFAAPSTAAPNTARAWDEAPSIEADSTILVLPYATSGVWLAGDAHVHTVTHSESTRPSSTTVRQTAEAMKAAGLDFTVITDHDVVTRLAAVDGFVLVAGVEVTANRPEARAHVVGIGASHGVHWPALTDQQVLEAIEAQGAMAVLAHPNARAAWATGESWPAATIPTLSNYTGIEIYNHMVDVNQKAGGQGWALDQWFAALTTGRTVWGLSVSDVHGPNGPFGHGYMVVQASDRSPAAVREALASGRFVSVVSPVASATTVWPVRIAASGETLVVESALDKPASAILVYDATGRVRQNTVGPSLVYEAAGDEGFLVVEMRGADGSRVFLQPVRVNGPDGMAPWERGEAAVAALDEPDMAVPQPVGGDAPGLGPLLAILVVVVLAALVGRRR